MFSPFPARVQSRSGKMRCIGANAEGHFLMNLPLSQVSSFAWNGQPANPPRFGDGAGLTTK
jgi:hypothetical protein